MSISVPEYLIAARLGDFSENKTPALNHLRYISTPCTLSEKASQTGYSVEINALFFMLSN